MRLFYGRNADDGCRVAGNGVVEGVGDAVLLQFFDHNIFFLTEVIFNIRIGVTDLWDHSRACKGGAFVDCDSKGVCAVGDVDEFNLRMRAAYDFDHLILSLRGMPNVDISGVQSLLELCEDLVKHGKTIAFCGVNDSVRKYFDRAGITKLLGEDAYYWSADKAILALLNSTEKV